MTFQKATNSSTFHVFLDIFGPGLIDSAKGSFSKHSLCRVGTSPQSKASGNCRWGLHHPNHPTIRNQLPDMCCKSCFGFIAKLDSHPTQLKQFQPKDCSSGGSSSALRFRLTAASRWLPTVWIAQWQIWPHFWAASLSICHIIIRVYRGINKCSSDSPRFSFVISINLSVGPWIINGSLLKGPPNS